MTKKQVALAAAGIIVLVMLAAGCVALTELFPKSESTVLLSDAETVNLVDGENLIKTAGVYHITGTARGYIHVNVSTGASVTIILDNVEIENDDGPAIYIESESETRIEYTGTNAITSVATEDLDSAIYSKGNLTLTAVDEAVLEIASTLDGIAGKANVKVEGGEYKITCGAKGLKAKEALEISGGKFEIESGDDAIHSNGSISLDGGEYSLSAGDDGIHADTELRINDGKVAVNKSVEGLEANQITLSGGNINVLASDDGINATNSDDSSTMMFRAGDAKLFIGGGEIVVTSDGDGLDSNGSIEITGGTIFINGPTSSADAAVDCDGEIKITGGTLVAVGSSGMAQNATVATQPSVLMNLTAEYTGPIEFGGVMFSPTKKYNSVLVSSSKLEVGKSYELLIDSKSVLTVEISDNVTSSGLGGGMMPGGGQGGGFGGERPNDMPNDAFDNGMMPGKRR